MLLTTTVALRAVRSVADEPVGTAPDKAGRRVDALGNTYRQAIASGQDDIQTVKEFCGLFPSTENFISYYAGTSPVWNSKAALYGRYVLTLQIDVLMNAERTKIVKYGQPRFSLVEVRDILPNAVSVTYNAQTEERFGMER